METEQSATGAAPADQGPRATQGERAGQVERQQLPTVSRILHYRLSESDAEKINRRRTDGVSISERLKDYPPRWPAGAQAHIGNRAAAGDVLPLIVTAASGNSVNGQVFLDGNDAFWVTSVSPGTVDGTWSWPSRS